MSNEPALGSKPSNAPSLSSSYPTLVYHHEDYRPEFASIEVTTRLLPFNRRFTTYRWIGPASAPVRINRYMVDPDCRTIDEAAQRLPWRLRKLPNGHDFLRDAADFVRVDGGLWVPALLTEWRHRLRDRWDWLTARMVLTLMVWGLAWVDEGTQPRWADVKRRHPNKETKR